MRKKIMTVSGTACAAAVILCLSSFYFAADNSSPAAEKETLTADDTEAISEAISEGSSEEELYSVSESVSGAEALSQEEGTEAESEEEISYNPVQADNVLIYLPSPLHQTGWQILEDGREQYQFSSEADVVNILIDSLAGYDDPESVAQTVLSTDQENYKTAADNGEITILNESTEAISGHSAYTVLYQAPYNRDNDNENGNANTLTYLTYIIDSGSSIVTVEYIYVEENGDPLQDQMIEMFNHIAVN